MKKLIAFPWLAASALVTFSSSSSAAILQSWAGPTTVSGGGNGTVLVDLGSDASDWITGGAGGGNYSNGSAITPLYFQFTMSVTNNAGETGGGGFFTGFQLCVGAANGGAGERFAVGNHWLSTAWGGFRGAGTGAGEYDLNGNPGAGGANIITPTETVSFVMKLDQANNSATVWFNPNLTLLEGAQDSGLTTSLTGLSGNDTFDSIWLRAGNGSGSTTFSDMSVRNDSPFGAVPEPSTALCFSFAGLALLRRRR